MDLDFFKRVVAFATEHKMLVIHDLAYEDLVFDGYKAPVDPQVHGAKTWPWELYSMSKGILHARLARRFRRREQADGRSADPDEELLDYGMFPAIQVAPTVALTPVPRSGRGRRDLSEGRDCLVEGVRPHGWEFEKPKGRFRLGADPDRSARWAPSSFRSFS